MHSSQEAATQNFALRAHPVTRSARATRSQGHRPPANFVCNKDILYFCSMSYPEKFVSIFARNCEVRRIGKTEAGEFLSRCHRYGDCASKYRYGLFVSKSDVSEYPLGMLVGVATFSAARRWEKESGVIRSYEWLRYSSLPEVRVIGGMGKVLKAFIDDVHPDDVMSYAPQDYYDGGVYETLGFIREGEKTFRLPDGTEAVSIKFRLRLTK